MNFVENNGKKVAAILCVASAFPVVATVVAAKEEPGWHGDRYVNEDKTVAKGWQEIEGKSYYFSENGTVNSSKTEKATTASVSSNITGEVKETVATASQEAVKEVVEEKAAEVVETPAETTEAPADTTEAPAETLAPTKICFILDVHYPNANNPERLKKNHKYIIKSKTKFLSTWWRLRG